jgi:MGT family glycosyltransferase
MARVLVYTTPGPGNIYPVVPTLLALRERGHELHVRTRDTEAERMRSLGLDAAAIDPRIQEIEIDDYRARSQIGASLRLLNAIAARGTIEIETVMAAVEEFRPDVLLVDATAQGAGYAAEASGLPWAHYCPFPPAIRSADAPPYGLGVAPARGVAGRMRDQFLYWLSATLLSGHVKALNELRAGLGLAPLASFDEQFRKSNRFILFTAEPYEYPRRDWPANVRLVGPGTWGPQGEAPNWLAAETRPIVLVTASTELQADAGLIETALAALADEPVAVVATTAAHDPSSFTAPANAHVERVLPHDPIIARAACVLSHGGQGTTQKALAAGVPVCVVPFCRDQFEVARRVEVADAGVRLSPGRLNPRRLRRGVREAISKRPGAERVARSFARAGGAAAAADAVEELVGLSGQDAAQQLDAVRRA